jgi:hypothetical protein
MQNFCLINVTRQQMKRILIIASFCTLGMSCETEALAIKSEPQDNLVGNASLTGKLLRMAQYPTAIDNMIDNTSCFAINFPYTVTVNNQTVAVTSENDYQTVNDILAENANDNDVVTIQFPVTVTYANYTEAAFATQAQLSNAITNCTASAELSCMGLPYPLTIKSYNSNYRNATTIDVANKKGLYQFLENISSYDAVAFEYPLAFITPSGSSINIENSSQLEAAIDTYTDDCQTGTIPDNDFDTVITQGTWYVSYFFRDSDETGDYAAYDFTFNPNGSITVTGGASPSTGTWQTYTDDSEQVADFTFSSNALEELEEDWTITEVTPTLIKMEHVSGGGDDIRYLYLAKN